MKNYFGSLIDNAKKFYKNYKALLTAGAISAGVALSPTIAPALIGCYEKPKQEVKQETTTQISGLDTLLIGKRADVVIPKGKENSFSYLALSLDAKLHNQKAQALFELNKGFKAYNKIKGLDQKGSLRRAKIENIANTLSLFGHCLNKEWKSFVGAKNYKVLEKNKELLAKNKNLKNKCYEPCKKKADELLSKKRLAINKAKKLYNLGKALAQADDQETVEKINGKLSGGEDYVPPTILSCEQKSFDQVMADFKESEMIYSGKFNYHLEKALEKKEKELEKVSDDQFLTPEEEEEQKEIVKELRPWLESLESGTIKGIKIKYLDFNPCHIQEIKNLLQ